MKASSRQSLGRPGLDALLWMIYTPERVIDPQKPAPASRDPSSANATRGGGRARGRGPWRRGLGLQLRATPRELGAAAYLAAPNSGDQLAAAVRDALLAPDSRAAAPTRPDRSGLTPRERELLLLISSGATNREIAAQLHLGPDAIKKNASALYRKLGVRNRIEAAKLASTLHAFPRS